MKKDIPKKNRRRSYNAVLPNTAARQAIILNILHKCGDMTAQEVATELHRRGFTVSDERNFAAPRLTELRDAGKVWPVGKKPCTKTGRMVTVWSVRKEDE